MLIKLGDYEIDTTEYNYLDKVWAAGICLEDVIEDNIYFFIDGDEICMIPFEGNAVYLDTKSVEDTYNQNPKWIIDVTVLSDFMNPSEEELQYFKICSSSEDIKFYYDIVEVFNRIASFKNPAINKETLYEYYQK